MNDITLRDHIAVEALKALIMEPQWEGYPESIARGCSRQEDDPAVRFAAAAYALADAMLAERERGA